MGEVLSGKLTLNERASKPRLGCFGLSKGYDEKNRVQETPDTVFYPPADSTCDSYTPLKSDLCPCNNPPLRNCNLDNPLRLTAYSTLLAVGRPALLHLGTLYSKLGRPEATGTPAHLNR